MDERLFERFRSGGDRESLAVLFRRLQEPVYRFLLGYCGNAALAEESVQETFLRIVRDARKYPPVISFRSWLYHIALNTARDMIASEKALKRREARIMETSGINEERGTDRHEDMEILRRELAELPEDLRIAVTMRYYCNLTYEEIGDTMRLPTSTVAFRVRSGMQKLGERLAQIGLAGMVPSLETLMTMSWNIPIPSAIPSLLERIAATARPPMPEAVIGAEAGRRFPVRVKGIIAAAVVILIGIGVFMIVRDVESPAPAVVNVTSEHRSRVPGAPTQSPVAEQARPSGPVVGTFVPLPKTAPGEQAEGASVGGVVTDEQGEAIAGAVIHAYRGEIVHSQSWLDYNRWDIRNMEKKSSFSLKSDGKGGYRLSGLPEGVVQLKCCAPGYLPTAKTFFLKEGARRTVDVALRKGAVVTGLVVDEEGTPIADARVTAGREIPLMRTGYARGPNRKGWEDGYTVTTLPLVVAESDLLNDTPLGAAPTNRDDFPNALEAVQREPEIAYARTGGEGRYRFLIGMSEGMFDVDAHGWYLLRVVEKQSVAAPNEPAVVTKTEIARSEDGKMGGSISVTGTTGGLKRYAITGDCEGPTFIMKRGLRYGGKVTDEDGHPLPDTNVICYNDFAAGEAVTDAEGRFTVIGDMRPGTYIVRAWKKDYGYSGGYPQVEIKEDIHDVTVVVRRGVTISGRVLDPSGKPVNDPDLIDSLTIHAVPLNWPEPQEEGTIGSYEEMGEYKKQIGKDGSFTLFPLERTHYRVEVSIWKDTIVQPKLLEIDLHADRNDIEFRLEEGWKVSGRVISSREQFINGKVEFVPSGAQKPYATVEVEPDGSFESRPLPPLVYTARFRDASRADVTGESQVAVTNAHVSGVSIFLGKSE